MADLQTVIERVEPYPEELTRLFEIDGFIEFWRMQIPYHRTYEKAYEYCESIHIKFLGRRKYKSFESFNMMVRRRMN